MTGDKQDDTARRKGARGRRRTRESVQANVTPRGLALVDAVDSMIDAKFADRQALLNALGKKAASAGLDRRKLSKQLGGPTKPQGPDWNVVALIVEGCVDDPALRPPELARLAGLFCVARDVPRPDPHYDGEIIWPTEPGGEKTAELPAVVTDMQQRIDTLSGQVDALAAHAMWREALLTELERENSRLCQQTMGYAVQLLLGRAELDKTQHAVEVHRRYAEALIAEQAARDPPRLAGTLRTDGGPARTTH